MKTLKKTLCLVLAVVMAVGVLVLPASAAETADDYVDSAQISKEYTAAVNIMTMLGVLNGKVGETFDPTGILTRGESAKIIAYVNLGSDVAKSMDGTNAFADVTGKEWYAGYVSYSKDRGIIAGKDGNRFDGDGQLTGVEYAKMLLVSLGFGIRRDPFTGAITNNPYVGANWSNNVIVAATNAGILDGMKAGFDIKAPLNREAAAQMTLNAAKFTRPTGEYVTKTENGVTYRTEVYTVPILESVFHMTVDPYCHAADGTPYVGWYLNGVLKYADYGVYQKKAESENGLTQTLVNTYKLNETIKYPTLTVRNTRIWYNGIPVSEMGLDLDDFFVCPTHDTTTAVNGLEVELYYIDEHVRAFNTVPESWHNHYFVGNANFYDLVINEASLGQVTAINEAKNGKPASIEITTWIHTTGHSDAARKLTATVEEGDALYAELVAKYQKDDYLAVYVTPELTAGTTLATTKTAILYDYADVTPVTGVVNKVNHGKEAGSATGYIRSTLSTLWLNGTSKTEGTKYELNNNFTNTKALEFTAMPNAHDKGTLYLYNGRGLGWVKDTTKVPGTAMITDMRNKLDANGYVRTYVDGVYEDGTAFENLLVSDRNTRIITVGNKQQNVVFNDIYDGAVHDYNWTVGKAYFVRPYLDDQYVDNFGFNRIWFGTDHPVYATNVNNRGHFNGLDKTDYDAVEYMNDGTQGLTKDMRSITLTGTPVDNTATGYFTSDVIFIYADGTVMKGMQNVPVGTRFAVVAKYNTTDKAWTISTVYVYAPYYKDYNETVFFIPSYSKDDLEDMDHDWCYDYGTTLKQAYEVINIVAYSVDGAKKTIKVYNNEDYRLYNNVTKLEKNGINAGFYQLQLMFKYNDEEIYGMIRADRNDIDGYIVAAGVPQTGTTATGGIINGETDSSGITETYRTVSGGITVVDTNDGKHSMLSLGTGEYVTFLYEVHGSADLIKSAAFIYKISGDLAYGDGLCNSKGVAYKDIKDLSAKSNPSTTLPVVPAKDFITIYDKTNDIVVSKDVPAGHDFYQDIAAQLKLKYGDSATIKVNVANNTADVTVGSVVYKNYTIYTGRKSIRLNGEVIGAVDTSTTRSLAEIIEAENITLKTGEYLKLVGDIAADNKGDVTKYYERNSDGTPNVGTDKAQANVVLDLYIVTGTPTVESTGTFAVGAGVTATVTELKSGADVTVTAGGTLDAGTVGNGAVVNVEKGGKLEADKIEKGAKITVISNGATSKPGDIMNVQSTTATDVQEAVVLNVSSGDKVTGVIGAVAKVSAATTATYDSGSITISANDYVFCFEVGVYKGKALTITVTDKDGKPAYTEAVTAEQNQYDVGIVYSLASELSGKTGPFTITVTCGSSTVAAAMFTTAAD